MKDDSWYYAQLLSFIDFENYIKHESIFALEMDSQRRFISESEHLKSMISVKLTKEV